MAAISGTATMGSNALATASCVVASILSGSAAIGTNAIATGSNRLASSLSGSANVGDSAFAVANLEGSLNVTGNASVGDTAAAVASIAINEKQSASASITTTGSATISSAFLSTGIEGSGLIGSYATASANVIGGSDTDGLSVCDIVDRTLELWGIFCRKGATGIGFAITRAISDLNHALQLVWNNADGRDYWTNETLTITIAADASSVDLPDNVLKVTGTCRRADNKQPLTLIGTVGELETYNDSFLDGEIAEFPIAYHIERLKQSANDPAKCVLHVNQAVDESTDFLIEVVREAPRMAVSDLDTCPLIPIPHQAVESLLLPIVRYHASNFYLFRQMDQKEDIKTEYQRAMDQLGLADPLPDYAGDNRGKGGDA